MMTQSILAAFLGGWELVLILAVLIVLACFVFAVLGIIFYVKRSSQNSTASVRTPIPPSKSRYFIYISQATAGPYTLEQLKALHDTRVVTDETLCCREGTEDWFGYASLLSHRAA